MPKFSVPVALSAFVFAFAFLPAAHGAAFLVGAQLYRSDNTGAEIECCYQFSTNTGTGGHSFFPLNQVGDVPDAGVVDRDIAFELGPGANSFSFESPTFSRPIYGLNLFFSDTATPLSVPPDLSSPGDPNGVPGDLTVFSVANSGFFDVPAAGTDVGSYGAENVDPAGRDPTSYSGDTEFVVGGLALTVSEFIIQNGGEPPEAPIRAVFTITAEEVTDPPDPPGDAVPAPGMLLLLGAAIAGLGFVRQRIV